MALVTGMLMGFIAVSMFPQRKDSPLPLIIGLIVGIISLLIHQLVAYSNFAGDKRGEFEYIYLQSLIDRRIKMFLDRLSYSPTIPLSGLLKKIETEPDPKRKYDIYMTMAWFAVREEQNQKAIEYLQEAATLKKNDLVASFRLGQSWERLGKGEEAIQAYEMALQDPSLDSETLREFVLARIEQVKTKGPQRSVPYPFFRYMGI